MCFFCVFFNSNFFIPRKRVCRILIVQQSSRTDVGITIQHCRLWAETSLFAAVGLILVQCTNSKREKVLLRPQNVSRGGYFLVRCTENSGEQGNPLFAIGTNAFRTTNFRSWSAMRGAEFHGNTRRDVPTRIRSIPTGVSPISCSLAPYDLLLPSSYWDPSFDDDLLEDRIAMNLIFVQAVNDIERGWVTATKDQHRQLTALQQRGSKKEVRATAWWLFVYFLNKFFPYIYGIQNRWGKNHILKELLEIFYLIVYGTMDIFIYTCVNSVLIFKIIGIWIHK